MRNVLVSLLMLVASVPALLAQGTDALPFTRIERNPVLSALGGAGSASDAAAPWAAFTNPSILPLTESRVEAAASWQRWAPSSPSPVTNFQGGVSVKLAPRMALTAGYARQTGAAMDILDRTGLSQGTFRPKDDLAALGVGIGLGKRFGLGVTARYARQQLTPEDRISGFSADAFLAFRMTEGLRLSAGLSTLGTSVSAQVGRKFSQPASFKAAADWTLALGGAHRLELVADADVFFNGKPAAAAGVQYDWKQTVYLRGGYRFAAKDSVIPPYLGLGAGFRLGCFHLDASWLTASSYLGNTLCVGAGLTF